MSLTRLFLSILLAVALLTGCGGGPTEPSDYEFGRLEVFVRDSGSGEPVNGVPVRLERLNGGIEEEGGLTGSVGLPGYYFFLRTNGNFRIVITPPAGYELAPGQSGSVPVSFTRNQLKTVNFLLRRI